MTLWDACCAPDGASAFLLFNAFFFFLRNTALPYDAPAAMPCRRNVSDIRVFLLFLFFLRYAAYRHLTSRLRATVDGPQTPVAHPGITLTTYRPIAHAPFRVMYNTYIYCVPQTPHIPIPSSARPSVCSRHLYGFTPQAPRHFLAPGLRSEAVLSRDALGRMLRT